MRGTGMDVVFIVGAGALVLLVIFLVALLWPGALNPGMDEREKR